MDFKLPNLGEGADSGTVVTLFVKEGDTISRDQPVLELENEKAVASIPSSVEGVVAKIHIQPGEKVSVGQRILTVQEGGSPAPDRTKAAATTAEVARERREEHFKQEPEETSASWATLPGIPPAAAPSIRRLARDLGLDLSRVRGSARGGRIVLEDVRAYIQRLQRLADQTRGGAASAAPAVSKPAAESVDFSKWGPISRQPLTPLRQVIARRMAENWNAVPHVTQFDEVDITTLNELRRKHAPAFQNRGARLTLTAFAVKTVVQTLKKHPVFNCSLDEAANQLVIKDYYHIGIAVDTEAGLIVPVIRDADKKSMLEISMEIEELAVKARDRKVSSADLKGGTFTISNQGGIGGAHFTPIVNKPEVAILGLGRGSMKAVVRGVAIEPRLIMPVGLSYDHRVIDGGAAARFIVDLVKGFETFPEDALR